MKDVQQETIYNNSLSIPAEIRADFAEVIEATIGRMSVSEPVWVYLFEVYNRYLTNEAGQQTDIGCHSCRYTVLKRGRDILQIWKTKEVQWLKKELT